MEVTMFFPLLLLICSRSTAQLQPESDNEITPLGDNQARQPANTTLHQPTSPQDIHAVLREMSGLMAELRVELRHLQRENDAHAAKLTELEKEQAGELTAIKARTSVTENKVEAQRRETEVKRVAFSYALYSRKTTIGPFNTDTTLVFRQLITNIGNAYNSNTGHFIAPVKGAYHFEFYIGAHGHPSDASGATLLRNRHVICTAFGHQPSGFGNSANGATLLLEVGDVVFVRLVANTRVFDNEFSHSTFSGHLLFPM